MKKTLLVLIFTFVTSACIAAESGYKGVVETKQKQTKPTISVNKTIKSQAVQEALDQQIPPNKENTIIPAKNDDPIRIEIIDPNGKNTDWFLYATAIGIPLIVLLITNFVTLLKIRMESKAAINNELKMNSINIKRDQLSLLYDPLIALTNTNFEVFSSFGPRTFPEDMHRGDEAKHTWDLLVKMVIIPNNAEIVKIIKSYTHLMHPADNFDLYLRFMKHAVSYAAFRVTPNEIHGGFSYPNDFLPNVRSYREIILSELRVLEDQIRK